MTARKPNSYYVKHRKTDIWVHPEIPSIPEWIDATEEDDGIEIKCPNPDGCPGGFTLAIDGEDEDFDELIDDWLDGKNNGTRRCKNCDEPLVGIRGGGDYPDDYATTGWHSP